MLLRVITNYLKGTRKTKTFGKFEQEELGVASVGFSTGENNSCLGPNIHNEFLHFDRIMLSGIKNQLKSHLILMVLTV